MVSLNILSSEIDSLKSCIARGDVFNVTIDGIPASLADFIPSGAFSTPNASLLSKSNLCTATLNGAGSGFPFLPVHHHS